MRLQCMLLAAALAAAQQTATPTSSAPHTSSVSSALAGSPSASSTHASPSRSPSAASASATPSAATPSSSHSKSGSPSAPPSPQVTYVYVRASPSFSATLTASATKSAERTEVLVRKEKRVEVLEYAPVSPSPKTSPSPHMDGGPYDLTPPSASATASKSLAPPRPSVNRKAGIQAPLQPVNELALGLGPRPALSTRGDCTSRQRTVSTAIAEAAQAVDLAQRAYDAVRLQYDILQRAARSTGGSGTAVGAQTRGSGIAGSGDRMTEAEQAAGLLPLLERRRLGVAQAKTLQRRAATAQAQLAMDCPPLATQAPAPAVSPPVTLGAPLGSTATAGRV